MQNHFIVFYVKVINASKSWLVTGQDEIQLFNRETSYNYYLELSIWPADAGKSTIGGQILLLSGQVDDRTIQKYEKEAKDKNRESW